MATKKESIVRETRTGKTDAIADTMVSGLETLVKHNKHLIAVDAHKDEMLLSVVEQASRERVEFARIHTTLIEQFSTTIDTIQKLKDKDFEREEKRAEAKATREMKEKAYGDVRQLVTIGINQFAKRPMLKESERGLLAEFIESFEEGQIEDLVTSGKLRPAQLAALSKLVDGLKAQEDKEAGTESEADNASH